MAYIDRASLKTFAGINSTGDDTLLDELIVAAQGEIDAFCRRSFEGTTGVRYYRESDLVPIDGLGRVLNLGKDLAALGGITNGDGTTIASTDCWVEPRNDPPYQYVRLKSGESWNFGTDGEIAVSGTWGYSTTADATIAEYTKETAAYLYRLRDAPVFDVVAEPASGTITVPKGMPVHVRKGLIDGGYRRSRGIQ